MSVLLYLLSDPVEVHSQTAPYVRFMGTNLPNHSYVDLTLVGDALDSSDSVQCHTDLRTCCNDAAGPDRGDWYFPNGTRLPFPNITFNIFGIRQAQRVDVRHRGRNDVTSGMYRCAVETNAVHDDDGRETVYIGLYASGGEEERYFYMYRFLTPHCVPQVMSPYQMVWYSLWTLISMEIALSSLSPVPPLVALLPLSLGPETLRQSQEG